MWYRKFAVILLFICLVAADSAGVQKILQISKEKGTVTEYKDPYPKIKKEVAYFPVAESKWDDRKTVAYGDSFMRSVPTVEKGDMKAVTSWHPTTTGAYIR